MSKQHQVEERGIAHLFLVLLVLTVITVVGVIGWRVAAHHKSSKGTGNPSSNSLPGSCLSKYNDGRLCQFAAHYTPINKLAFKADVHVTSPQGTPSALTYSSDGKGNTSVVGTSEGQQLSVIILNNATYIRTSGSGWIEYPAGAANTPAETDPTANMDIGVGTAGLSFQYLDTMSCGNLTCYKYQVTNHALPGTTQYIWFDTENYMLRQWSYQGGTGDTTMTITYQPVSISAPAPVQVV